MSSRNKDGSWTIPQQQVEEFLYNKIDYNKLIQDCLKLSKKTMTKQANFGRYIPAAPQSDTVEAAGNSFVRLLNTKIF